MNELTIKAMEAAHRLLLERIDADVAVQVRRQVASGVSSPND